MERSPRKEDYEGPFRYKDRQPSVQYPFKGPDNEQCLSKVKELFPYSVVVGGAAGVVDVMAYAPKIDHVSTAFRFVQTNATAVGMMGAYVAGVCLSSHLRGGKSDPLNHFNGGALSGLILGVRLRSIGLGLTCALSFGITAAALKDVYHNGLKVIRQDPRPMSFGFRVDHYRQGFGTKRMNVLGRQDSED